MFAYAKSEQKKESKDTVQKKKTEKVPSTPNLTGISDVMKTRFENLSGFSFDDVRVHYNSDKPAQLQALAYTQGNQVYIAPSQEEHLGHELGHVVQQKQNRVSETIKIYDTPVNASEKLEQEADLWSNQVYQANPLKLQANVNPMQALSYDGDKVRTVFPNSNGVVQLCGEKKKSIPIPNPFEPQYSVVQIILRELGLSDAAIRMIIQIVGAELLQCMSKSEKFRARVSKLEAFPKQKGDFYGSTALHIHVVKAQTHIKHGKTRQNFDETTVAGIVTALNFLAAFNDVDGVNICLRWLIAALFNIGSLEIEYQKRGGGSGGGGSGGGGSGGGGFGGGGFGGGGFGGRKAIKG